MSEDFTTSLPLVNNDPYLAPHMGDIRLRMHQTNVTRRNLAGNHGDLASFATGHHYFGLLRKANGWVLREWAPNATAVYLIGDFNSWQVSEPFACRRLDDNGTWELHFNDPNLLQHGQHYKLKIFWPGGEGERLPSYANYVVQDTHSKLFSGKIWAPEYPYQFKNPRPKKKDYLLIYEAHVGMAQEEGSVGSFDQFRTRILPRIQRAGYNAIQLMAIQEHPYYGSFGYQVSNFFAPSSRFGTPDDLKRLIDDAHAMGIHVIMDIVHSHAVKNENEGLGRFDGTSYQYFHDGGRGDHLAWDTKCFNYGKPQVLHFLLSNCAYWLQEFQFDGFRFDGVTSMLYWDHGLGKAFTCYGDYFSMNTDMDALVYLTLANELIHQLNPAAVTIAEDMSGMPGLAFPVEGGGLGFDYRLAMGGPDFWIKLIKERADEYWNMDELFQELASRRWDEKTINYCESHDQALVGDKTIIFRLIDADMYWHFAKHNRNLMVDRGIALHKMIRLITMVTSGGGYLNFMGNEFGHPEWIDFPRDGNGHSYHYARRQWSLRDHWDLCYEYLANFDQEMIGVVKEYRLFDDAYAKKHFSHCSDMILAIERKNLLFVFNFHPVNSYRDYGIYAPTDGQYREILHSDEWHFGGHGRLVYRMLHQTTDHYLRLYLPARSVMVLAQE